LNVFAHKTLKRWAARIRDVPQANLFGLAVQQAHHDCFTGAARVRDLGLFVLVHESSGATDKRLVNLKCARVSFKAPALHRKPDAMSQVVEADVPQQRALLGVVLRVARGLLACPIEKLRQGIDAIVMRAVGGSSPRSKAGKPASRALSQRNWHPGLGFVFRGQLGLSAPVWWADQPVSRCLRL